MKRVFAIFTIVALAACGGASTEVKTDSTTVVKDTTVKATDSIITGGSGGFNKPTSPAIK